MATANIFILLGLLVFTLDLTAKSVDQIPNHQSMRVGVYVGTFDPPHAGHIRVAQKALDLGLLDYVLFFPNDKTSYKPTATPFHLRFEMSSISVQSHKKIFVPMPRRGSILGYITDTLLELKRAKPNIQLVGMMGTDVAEIVLEIPLERKQWMQLVDYFLINERDGYNQKNIPLRLEGKSVMTYNAHDGGLSSSEIKKMMATGSRDISAQIQDEVLKLIKSYHLFSGQKSCRLVYLMPAL